MDEHRPPDQNRKSALIEIPFFPVLICIYLPLKLLAPNLAVFELSQGIRPILVMAVVVLVSLLLLTVLLRNKRPR